MPRTFLRRAKRFFRMIEPRQPLFRLLASHLALGVVAAVIVVGGLLIADAHGIRTLMARSQEGVLVLAIMFFGFVVTFGSAAMGAAVMMMPSRDGRGGGGSRRTADAPALQRVPVEAVVRRRR